MAWTREQKIEALLRLPWTIDVERNADDGYIVLRARELQGTIATGAEADVEREFWDSMRATLACHLDFDDPIPLPCGVQTLPWEAPALTQRVVIPARQAPEAFVETSGSARAYVVGAA